jgi:protein arginine kinase
VKLSELAKHTSHWLTPDAPDSDVVISSRIRVARNLLGYPFTNRASDEQCNEIVEMVHEQVNDVGLGDDVSFIDLHDCSTLDRKFLVERHLISREIAERSGSRGVAFSMGERVSMMVNEEDHIRLQAINGGLDLESLWENLSSLDDRLDDRLHFAFSPRLGYLTACPTNVGTGMRVSVMMHLPALVLTKEIDKVFRAVTKLNLVVRGLFGEGTQATGDVYQVSNQVTLGLTEEDIVRRVEAVAPQVIRYERLARQSLMRSNRVTLEDRIWRAYGMLRNARTITSEETMHYLSALRMGVNMGLIETVKLPVVNDLFYLTQPAHLQKMRNQELPSDTRNVLRARFIREKLEETN